MNVSDNLGGDPELEALAAIADSFLRGKSAPSSTVEIIRAYGDQPDTTTTEPRETLAHVNAVQSFKQAAEFLTMAAERIAEGAPADCLQIAQWIDFGKRKVWQGEEELAGRPMRFKM